METALIMHIVHTEVLGITLILNTRVHTRTLSQIDHIKLKAWIVNTEWIWAYLILNISIHTIIIYISSWCSHQWHSFTLHAKMHQLTFHSEPCSKDFIDLYKVYYLSYWWSKSKSTTNIYRCTSFLYIISGI